jgi:hypothetical protein
MATDPAMLGPSSPPEVDRSGEPRRPRAALPIDADPTSHRLKNGIRRLLTALWLLLVIGLVVGVVISLGRAWRHQRHSMATTRLQLLGASILFVPVSDGWPNNVITMANLSAAGARGVIGDADLRPLKALERLEDVDLSQCLNITDAGLGEVAAIPTIKVLKLGTEMGVGPPITDAGLIPLTRLRWLEVLDLSQCGRITDQGLKTVALCQNLKELSLRSGMAPGPRVTDAGLSYLASLGRLQSLSLAGTEITDAGLRHLKGLPRLESLDLSGTRVTDAGMVHLLACKRLKTLILDRTRVDEQGVVPLQSAFPTLEVHLNDLEPGSDSGGGSPNGP